MRKKNRPTSKYLQLEALPKSERIHLLNGPVIEQQHPFLCGFRLHEKIGDFKYFLAGNTTLRYVDYRKLDVLR
eukprot:snap_masked-scaffold_5-processed-gene-10.11-mRNA-1 protein AED:0.45 eAED:1.00 QI:0/-1/0/1/-1/1/1/0/72